MAGAFLLSSFLPLPRPLLSLLSICLLTFATIVNKWPARAGRPATVFCQLGANVPHQLGFGEPAVNYCKHTGAGMRDLGDASKSVPV
jgi:hypothetical protein